MFLNCHSYFSFKYGTFNPEELLAEAQRHGVSSLVLTDINNTSGILDFIRIAPKYGVKPVAGIDFRDGAEQQFIGIAKNNEGFYELNKLLSEKIRNPKDEVHPSESDNYFIVYPFHNTPLDLRLTANAYIGVKPSDLNRLRFSEWKKYLNKLVILSPVTFRNKIDFNTHRLLRAIDNNTLLSKLPVSEQAQPDEIMMTERELENIYHEYPELIRNTKELLEKCRIDFVFGESKNKKSFCGSVTADMARLKELCEAEMPYRYERPDEKIRNRIDKELRMIREKDFASYFLINHDIVKYARHRNFFYVGRGSGANSIVAYLLRITDVDPIDLDLYFERFINPSRINPPDFDIDFSWKDRDEIIDYIFEKYTPEKTALLATYSSFKDNSIVRELGKVFGLPKAEIDALLDDDRLPETPDHIASLIYRYAERLYDVPSHLSIHAGGILISEKPINYYTATSMPPKGYPLTQFSMIEAEDVGLYKFDILSQRGLGHIKDAVEEVKRNQGISIDIHDVKRFKQDERIKELLRTAKCIGCFYVESPAMRMLLKKLEVDNYLGLVAASSIIRPGVAQSGMMREYIIRYRNPEKASYTHPKMKELMEETYGVMVYQEDVIKVAHEFAGLSLGEADMMRRGMSGKFRAREEFQRVKEQFFANCRERGYTEEVISEVWRQTESFAGYAFSKGHSASYAVESYQSLFLKAYYPLEHMVGVINNHGGFYRTEIYVHEARMLGAAIHAPDINRSEYLTTIYGKDIYLGLSFIKEFEEAAANAILTERSVHGKFLSLEDFLRRVSISVEQLRILIRINAFRFTGRTKQQLLWDIHSVLGAKKKTDVHEELFEIPHKEFSLPPLYKNELDDAWDELEILDFPLCSPFKLLKDELPSDMLAADLPKNIGKQGSIVGYLVTTKYASTKRGDRMFFGTFLDKNGFWIDTTHFPRVAALYRFKGRGCYLIKGRVDEEFGFCSITVDEMHRLDYVGRHEEKKTKEVKLTS